MRWATYVSPLAGTERPALVVDGVLHGLRGDEQLIDLLDRLPAAAEQAVADPLEVVPEAGVVLRAPVPVPPSIRDFMAFEEHVVTSMQAIGQELHPTWYEIPVFYFTNPAAVLGPHDAVEISPGSEMFDYELEVAAVIGTPGSDLDPADAASHIAGYTILCDWSARDLQMREMALGLGPAKGKDSATSLGPYLVTPDELGSLDLAMTASVNGTPYSAGNLSDLYWSFAQLVAYASRGTRLVPGDVIGSGTVGTGCILELSRVHGTEKYPWLAAGDEVRLEVAGLGAQVARVEPARELKPLGARARR
ncbi:fumarylacetoacetate hydrolase family protein [Pseudonocardia sp.]|uniref:fumarylacetoacetate hydrolase family protein n=1 Tax=Pseudonocardia sp. TaxID=60912 RepID=UPI002627D951|nr:fumarylacetoacetate hydrolase family protein [Pseudonocardia sp.]MCW2721040.1 fumarylacetoacetate hydrolase [Pseudonocardia sp.]